MFVGDLYISDGSLIMYFIFSIGRKCIHTQKKERNTNITLKIVIKSQGKRAKEEKRNKKEPQKQSKNN